MKVERTCSQAEQAVGWALHALEPAEEDTMSEHVPQCPICQELVRQTQDVVRAMASAHEQLDPPARLRARLMAAVAATPQLPVEQRQPPWTPVQPKLPAAERTRVPGGWSESSSPKPSAQLAASSAKERARRQRRLIAVAATVVVAIVGIGGVAIEVDRARQHQAAALSAPPPEASHILADLDRSGARHALLYAPNGQVLAAIALYQGERHVMPIGLKANKTNTVYVLWGVGDRLVPLATFDVTGPSDTLLPLGAINPADKYSKYDISIEEGRTAPPLPSLVVASGQMPS